MSYADVVWILTSLLQVALLTWCLVAVRALARTVWSILVVLSATQAKVGRMEYAIDSVLTSSRSTYEALVGLAAELHDEAPARAGVGKDVAAVRYQLKNLRHDIKLKAVAEDAPATASTEGE